MTRTVIAEIGINHDGDMDKARRLIQQSRDAGCGGIKFQYRNLSTAYAPNSNEIGDEIVLTQIKRTFLNAERILQLRDFARSIGVEAGISFFTAEDLKDFMHLEIDFDFFKIPSAELLNLELIRKLLQTGKHVYISVGMHNESEVEYTFRAIKDYQNWTPMHCISNYPLADHNTALGYIIYLREKWKRKVGYSSHDENWENNLIALSLGATVIERHITEEKSAEGLDHSSSSNYEEFARICYYAREFDLITSGNGPRIPNQGELLNKQNLGRSFYALRDMRAGQSLKISDFEYRNPQIGLGIADLEQYLDKKIVMNLDKGEVLTRQHFQENRTQVNEDAFKISRQSAVSIPVRLADYWAIRAALPVGAYEFHLSYKEVASDLLSYSIESTDKFSVHLPDYVNSTTLIDPFSADISIRQSSRECIGKVIAFSENLALQTGYPVPIVASLAGIGMVRDSFYPQVRELFSDFHSKLAPLTLQWLPPYAWYFGGSIKLPNVNNLEDVSWIKKFSIPITLDISHILLGETAFAFDARELIQNLKSNIVHWHISDASGLDGEGLPIGSGGIENERLISSILDQEGLKVIEVWQGHFYNYEGFKVAINKIAKMKGLKK